MRIARSARQRGVLVAIAVVALLAPSCWKPELTATYDVTAVPDVVYGQGEVDGGGTYEDLLLDLYLPEVEGQSVFPLMVIIHGGGFTGGSRKTQKFVDWANGFASRGYVVASMDYRTTNDDPVPSSRVQPLYDLVGGAAGNSQEIAAVAAIDDTLTALDFLHARPDVQPWQTVLMGSSAGGVTSLYVGYGLDNFDIERPPVNAVVNLWGGFATEDGADALDGEAANDFEQPYLYWEPPMFMAYGTEKARDVAWAAAIIARAAEIDHSVTVHAEVGAGHGFDLFNAEYSPGVSVYQGIVNWLDSNLVGVQETNG